MIRWELRIEKPKMEGKIGRDYITFPFNFQLIKIEKTNRYRYGDDTPYCFDSIKVAFSKSLISKLKSKIPDLDENILEKIAYNKLVNRIKEKIKKNEPIEFQPIYLEDDNLSELLNYDLNNIETKYGEFFEI